MKTKNVKHRRIVLFDMDNTLVCADTGDLWIEFLFNHKYVNKEQLNLRKRFKNDYDLGKLNIHESYSFEIELIKSLPVHERDALQTQFFTDCILPHISSKGLQLVKWHQQASDTIVILITATVNFIAAPIAKFIGIEHLISTMINVYDNEPACFIQGVPSFGAGKIERFNQWKEEYNVISTHTTLYSDSINDLPLLSYVDSPIVVDPDDALRKIALNKNWPITSFKNSPVDKNC